jgi:hypothetical protein
VHVQALLKMLVPHSYNCFPAFSSNCTNSLFTPLLHLFTSLHKPSGKPNSGLGAPIMKPGSLHFDLAHCYCCLGDTVHTPLFWKVSWQRTKDFKLCSVESWNPELTAKSSRKKKIIIKLAIGSLFIFQDTVIWFGC